MADKDASTGQSGPAGAARGLARGLTQYGDGAFSPYLRRSFAKSMGYSHETLDRPILGIADARSGFDNCHPEHVQQAELGCDVDFLRASRNGGQA